MACFSLAIQLTGWVSQAIFITVNSILFVCAVIGNSLVVYLIWSRAALKSPTYLLISFLAASDLLTSLFGQLLFGISVNIREADLSCYMVKTLIFMNVANCTSSLLLLSLIARDRYLHVSKRRNYLDHTSNRFAIIASIACYLFGTIVGALFIIDAPSVKTSGTIAFAVIGTSSFIFICLKSRQIMKIVKGHIRHMEANRQNNTAFEHTSYMRSFKIEKSVNRSIFSVIVLFFASWTPVIIVMTIFTVQKIRNQPITDGLRMSFNWASTGAYLNGAVNHIIYSHRCDAIGREIRRTVAKIFRGANVTPSSIQQEILAKNCEQSVIATTNKINEDHNDNIAS